jgi:hypothetical protein
MVYFQTKSSNSGKFWRDVNWNRLVYSILLWNISWPFGCLVTIWYISPRFGILCREKIWQPCNSNLKILCASWVFWKDDYFPCWERKVDGWWPEICELARHVQLSYLKNNENSRGRFYEARKQSYDFWIYNYNASVVVRHERILETNKLILFSKLTRLLAAL